MVYLMMHLIHFFNGHVIKDQSDSKRGKLLLSLHKLLAARDLLFAPFRIECTTSFVTSPDE